MTVYIYMVVCVCVSVCLSVCLLHLYLLHFLCYFSLVPTLAVGFDDLKKRIQEQEKDAKDFHSTLEVRLTSYFCIIIPFIHSLQLFRSLRYPTSVVLVNTSTLWPNIPSTLHLDCLSLSVLLLSSAYYCSCMLVVYYIYVCVCVWVDYQQFSWKDDSCSWGYH